MFPFHDCLNPFFQGVTAEMAAGGIPASPPLFQSQQSQGVPLPVRSAAKHRLVTVELHVPVCQDVQRPHQRVEPVEAQCKCQQRLPQRVKTPDVFVFMGQDAGENFPVLHPSGQQDHRIHNAIGQGRGDSVAGPHLHRPA